jgi:hypothetical protein
MTDEVIGPSHESPPGCLIARRWGCPLSMPCQQPSDCASDGPSRVTKLDGYSGTVRSPPTSYGHAAAKPYRCLGDLSRCSKLHRYSIAVAASTFVGRWMVKVEPRPTSLSTVISPPIIWQNRLLIARPSPVPPYFRVVDASACENS